MPLIPQLRNGAIAAAIFSSLCLSSAAFAEMAPAAPAKAPAAPAKSAAATPANGSAKTADAGPQLPKLTVAQIVAKHVAARGTPEAWKGVRSLQLTGKLEAGRGSMDSLAMEAVRSGKHVGGKEGTILPSVPEAAAAKPQAVLPFVMDFERPNRSRLEVVFDGKTAVQVYDGANGWKYRPYLNRSDVEPFTAEETKSEATRAEPEGVLVDYAAKGSTVALDGTEKVAGLDTYRLKVTQKGGRVVHVWIDAQNFLDVRVEGQPQRMDGRVHDVHVAQRDFRKVDGVTIPFLLETSVVGYPDSHKLMVEKAVVNPTLDASTFSKPKV